MKTKVVIKEGTLFRKIINGLKELITDSAEITFNEKGMYIQTIDPTQVVMIDLYLDHTIFESVTDMKIIINFAKFNDILKLGKNEKIELILDSENSITIKMINDNKRNVKFNMNITNDETEEFHVDELNYDIITCIETNEFQKIVKDLSTFGNQCRITINEEISFSVVSDICKGEILTSGVKKNDHKDKEYSALFNFKYLNIFSKVGLSNEITFKFSKDIPGCYEYNNDNGYLRFYLSEMVE